MSIAKFKNRVEKALLLSVSQMGEKTPLRDACEYALVNGGKRFRPILTLAVADALGKNRSVIDAAIAVECFHSASLIADDLPSMDNDAMRREKPSLHTVFGESVAILASYALIAEGYGRIAVNGQKTPKIALYCIQEAQRCAGIQGATNGQFLDLFERDIDLDLAKKIIYQKTITLFEIALLFGWLFGGGDFARKEEVLLLAYHFGMAFQVADDLLDITRDASRKNSGNIALYLGEKEAFSLFEKEMQELENSLKKLGLLSPCFREMISWLEKYPKTLGKKSLARTK